MGAVEAGAGWIFLMPNQPLYFEPYLAFGMGCPM